MATTQTDRPKGACTLCDVIKPDERALQDHVLNVHPDEHCRIYHQQPCQHDRREQYMAALMFADPYSLLSHRGDRVRLANAVMAVADTEQAAALHAAADLVAADTEIHIRYGSATDYAERHAGLLRDLADRMQYGDDAEMAASYRRDGFGPDEIAELLRPQTPA